MTISRIVDRGDLIEISSADIDTSYVALDPLPYGTRLIKFKNGTNGDVRVTYDNTVDQMWFSAGMSQVEDQTSNADPAQGIFIEPAGRVYYVKWDGSAPGNPKGSFFIETNHASTGL